jgi:hypothetical protein
MYQSSYSDPVARLLSYGNCQEMGYTNWPDYVKDLSLTEEHVPELIRMAQDLELWNLTKEDLDPEGPLDWDLAIWAPIHAWRALGQLQATAAILPLVEVLENWDLDWCWEELPRVFGMIGPDAIEPLMEQIRNPDLNENNRLILGTGLKQIAEQFPEQRDRIVAAITDLLSEYDKNTPVVNAGLVTELVHLEAVESAPVMEQAFAANAVDETIPGTWPRVQVDLGLKKASDFTAEELRAPMPPALAAIRETLDALQQRHKPSAVELGLPIDYRKLQPDKPPEFKDMAKGRAAKPSSSKSSGFGGGSSSGGKKKKKKKR